MFKIYLLSLYFQAHKGNLSSNVLSHEVAWFGCAYSGRCICTWWWCWASPSYYWSFELLKKLCFWHVPSKFIILHIFDVIPKFWNWIFNFDVLDIWISDFGILEFGIWIFGILLHWIMGMFLANGESMGF